MNNKHILILTAIKRKFWRLKKEKNKRLSFRENCIKYNVLEIILKHLTTSPKSK